jgi:hypothetical protein
MYSSNGLEYSRLEVISLPGKRIHYFLESIIAILGVIASVKYNIKQVTSIQISVSFEDFYLYGRHFLCKSDIFNYMIISSPILCSCTLHNSHRRTYLLYLQLVFQLPDSPDGEPSIGSTHIA